MTPIDKLPIEVVHAIVARVEARGLLTVALVSHFFNGAATPRIYAEVRYTRALVEKWGKIVCPLELLSTRSDLLACLKSLEIHDVPKLKQSGARVDPEFIRACLDVVRRAPALVSFTRGSYHDFRLYQERSRRALSGNRGPDEDSPPSLDVLLLKHLGPVKHISIGSVPEETHKAFVGWATSGPKDRLTSLGISENPYLEVSQLRCILDHAPNLKSLSILNCINVLPSESLALIRRFELESLELNIIKERNINSLSAIFPIVPTLRHVSFDILPPMETITGQQYNTSSDPLTEQLLLHILEWITGPKLHSLILRLADTRMFTRNCLNTIISAHATALRKLHLSQLRVPAQLIASMIRDIPGLEDLGVMFQEEALDDFDPIVKALSTARHLHTLTDTTPSYFDSFSSGLSRTLVLNGPQAEQLLRAGPALRYVVSLQFECWWMKSYIWSKGETKIVVSSHE